MEQKICCPECGNQHVQASTVSDITVTREWIMSSHQSRFICPRCGHIFINPFELKRAIAVQEKFPSTMKKICIGGWIFCVVGARLGFFGIIITAAIFWGMYKLFCKLSNWSKRKQQNELETLYARMNKFKSE